MPDDVTSLLTRLEGVLRRSDLPVVAHLAPPASAQEVRAALVDLGLRPEPAVLAVFTWHDGVASADGYPERAITPRLVEPLSLADALIGYRSMNEFPETQLLGWFPVFTILGGWVAVDCRHDSPHPGAARGWCYGEHLGVCDSLAQILGWWLDRWETGDWSWGPGWEDITSADMLTAHQLASGML